MAKIDSYAELQEAIHVLESKQKEDLKNLKKEFSDVKERLKPKNLMHEGLNRIRHSTALRNTLIATGAAILSIIAIKKVRARRRRHHEKKNNYAYERPAAKQSKQISKSVIRYILTVLVSRYADTIKDVVYSLLNRMKSSPPKQTETVRETQ